VLALDLAFYRVAGKYMPIQIRCVKVNTLIDLYCKCSKLAFARKLLILWRNCNLVSWTTMNVGYIYAEFVRVEAVDMFWQLSRAG
jgi:hypothetical protein